MRSILSAIRRGSSRPILVPNSVVMKLPIDDYLTVMAHRHERGDPSGKFVTMDPILLSNEAILTLINHPTGADFPTQ